MADGGLFGSIKRGLGLAPPETMSEKFARQDAERAPKAPAAAPAPAPAPSTKLGGMDTNVVNQRLKKAEEGMADGGAVKKKPPIADGDAEVLSGPGTGTSDDIPAEMERGTYIVPADSTEEVMLSDGETAVSPEAVMAIGEAALAAGDDPMAAGQAALDALREVTHTPADQQQAEQGQPPEQLAGDDQVQEFAGGGTIGDDDPLRRRVAPYVNHRAPNGPPAVEPPLQLGNNARPPGAAIVPNTGPNFTMGGNGPAAPAAAPIDPATDVRAKYNPANGSPEARAWQASRAAPPVGAAPVAAAPAAAVVEPGAAYRAGAATGRGLASAARMLGQVAPVAALADTATQGFGTPTEAYEKRFGLGPNSYDGVTGFARDVGVRALGAASDLGNAMTGGLAGNLYRDKQEAQQVAPAATPQAAAAPVRAPGPNAGAGRGFVNPPLADPNAAPPVAPQQPIANNVSVVPAFVGTPTEDFLPKGFKPQVITQGQGQDWQGRQDLKNAQTGASSIVPGASREAAKAEYAQLLDAREQGVKNAGAEAVAGTQAEAQRYGADQQAATQQGAQAVQAQHNADTNKIATGRLGLDTSAASLDARIKGAVAATQERLMKAKTPEERQRAEDDLRALQGRYEREVPNRFTVVPGGADDNGVKQPSRVLNNQTGQYVDQPGAAPKSPYTDGQVLRGKDGKTYVVKNGQPVLQ